MLIGTPEFRPGVFPAFLDLCIGVAVAIPFPGLRNRMLRPHSPHETGARRRARPMMPRHDKIHVRHPAIEQKGLLPDPDEIGRAHVRTPVTNAHLVCRLLLEKKKTNTIYTYT